MKITPTIATLLLSVASAKNLRGQDSPSEAAPVDATQQHGRNTGFLDEFISGIPSFGGNSEDGGDRDFPDIDFPNFGGRPGNDEDGEDDGSFFDRLNLTDALDDLTDHIDDFLDNNNITEHIDDFFGKLNISDGDWLPPCPPDEFLERLNMTQDDISCDPDFEFLQGGNYSDIIGNFTELIPCPSEEVLEHLNITVDDLPCNPDIDFGNFTGHAFSLYNFTDMVPCPPEEFLERLDITQDDLPCNPDLDFPNFEDRFNFTRPDGGFFERPSDDGSLECDEPVVCGLLGGRSGVVVCRESPFKSRKFNVCVDPSSRFGARDSDVCGCCDGTCPQACTSECEMDDDGETGVWIETRFGTQRCVNVEDSVSLQVINKYTCGSP